MRSISLEDGKLEFFSNLKAGELRPYDKLCNDVGLRDILGDKNPKSLLKKLKGKLHARDKSGEYVIQNELHIAQLRRAIGKLEKEIALEESKVKIQRSAKSTFITGKIVKDDSYPNGYKFIYKKRRDPNDPNVIAERKQRAENAQKNRERKERIAKSKLKKMYNN